MQLHQIKLNNPKPERKRVGRGGKRGTYSGKGQKGQKARSPIKPDFRGGNAPIWKLFPKQRGASKKTKIKHRFFRLRKEKPAVLNLGRIKDFFQEGDTISPVALVEKKLLKSEKQAVKILGDGAIDKKLIFENLPLSKTAKNKIIEAGGSIKK